MLCTKLISNYAEAMLAANNVQFPKARTAVNVQHHILAYNYHPTAIFMTTRTIN